MGGTVTSVASALSRYAIHTQTIKSWSLRQCVEAFWAAGFGGIGVWRHVLQETGIREAARILADSPLKVPSLVRGGFFVSPDAAARAAALDDNRRCLDEAAAIGAEMVVLVVGASPRLPLAESRRQVADSLEKLIPHAAARNIKLAVEPLHPMYAADKSCINRLADTRAIWQLLDHPLIGVALDVYHVWWDPDLEKEIALAGAAGRLFGYHVCDWRVDTRHLQTDRGLMGDGCIDIQRITRLVHSAGFSGLVEVEVFSEEYWASQPEQYLQKIVRACQSL